MIIIVFGLPGSGKSYFASHLAEMMNAVYINSDRLRKQMFDKRSYTSAEKQLVYDEMLAQLKNTAQQHKNIVLDATFYKTAIRKKFADAIREIDTAIFIEVWAGERLIKERLQRTREDSDGDFEVYKKIKQEWDPMEEAHLTLQSTNDNISDMLAKTSQYLHPANDKTANR